MLVGVLNVCNVIMRRFLWGERVEGDSKIAWVKWERVGRSREEGGLGVKDLGVFNRALLGKWRWGLLVGEEGLWARIIRAKYGSGDLGVASVWWRDLNSVCAGEENGKWFDDNIRKKIGAGNSVQFWRADWLGKGALEVLYNRLFHLSSQKEASIKEM